MASAAASSVLRFIAPQTLALCNSTSHSPPFISLSFPPLKLHAVPCSISRPLLASRSGSSSSRFVLKAAASLGFEHYESEEELVCGADDRESFSSDLKLFVGNLPFNVDSSALAKLFQQAGDVQMVEVIYDKVTQRSRGFGFVTMSTSEEVRSAAEQFNGYELDGRPLRVNSGPPPPRRERQFSGGNRSRGGFDDSNRNRGGSDDSNRLYVGNLSWGVDDSALETLFSEQGKVLEARVVYDRESGRSRGFGFVTYSSSEAVSSAIESLDGFDLNGRQIRVSVAEARAR